MRYRVIVNVTDTRAIAANEYWRSHNDAWISVSDQIRKMRDRAAAIHGRDSERVRKLEDARVKAYDIACKRVNSDRVEVNNGAFFTVNVED